MEQKNMNKNLNDNVFRQAASGDEQILRNLFRDFSEAIKSKDIEKIMSFYTPDVVAFDIVPPLQFVGRDAFQKSWERFAREMKSVDVHEVQDLKITVSGDVAFAHGLVHIVGTTQSGETMDSWMHLTDGFRKINGRWLVAHEQISMPIDMKSGKARWDLKPEASVH